MTNTNLRTQIATLAKTFAPDERLDLPVQRARDAARDARAELEAAKARLNEIAKAYQPGKDRSALNNAEAEVERTQQLVRLKLEACVKAAAHRESEFQRAALAAFDKARPVLIELTEAMNELSEALQPLQTFASERNISNTRAGAWVPGVRSGAEALAHMARH